MDVRHIRLIGAVVAAPFADAIFVVAYDVDADNGSC